MLSIFFRSIMKIWIDIKRNYANRIRCCFFIHLILFSRWFARCLNQKWRTVALGFGTNKTFAHAALQRWMLIIQGLIYLYGCGRKRRGRWNKSIKLRSRKWIIDQVYYYQFGLDPPSPPPPALSTRLAQLTENLKYANIWKRITH